ncbi:hypothetical protein [Acinetobacter rudis]|uniref:hypothetical protein n=1 Tax=Acinetobacter rudis TaxID=632955 RepID=UPI00333E9069
MSYKHNDLLAMRQSYWGDEHSERVQSEKQYFQQLLNEYQIFTEASVDDAKYFFFSLPSIIIVKGYALGFTNQLVKNMILDFVHAHKVQLSQRQIMKIKFRI